MAQNKSHLTAAQNALDKLTIQMMDVQLDSTVAAAIAAGTISAANIKSAIALIQGERSKVHSAILTAAG